MSEIPDEGMVTSDGQEMVIDSDNVDVINVRSIDDLLDNFIQGEPQQKLLIKKPFKKLCISIIVQMSYEQITVVDRKPFESHRYTFSEWVRWCCYGFGITYLNPDEAGLCYLERKKIQRTLKKAHQDL